MNKNCGRRMQRKRMQNYTVDIVGQITMQLMEGMELRQGPTNNTQIQSVQTVHII